MADNWIPLPMPSIETAFDLDFVLRLVINLITVMVLIRLYYRVSSHRDNAAAFMLFGVVVFFVTKFLHTAEVSMGFAFGLFAVFSMLRYRTQAIGIKEMTWLFLVIGVALLTAIAPLRMLELVALNTMIVGIAWLLETRWMLPLRGETEIEYEKIENIQPHKKQELIQDLAARTGLHVLDAEVVSVNFLRDTAVLRLHYHKGASAGNTPGNNQ